MAPAGCCGSRRRASSRERSRRIGPGGGWRPAVNGPGRLLRGLAGRMRSRCVPCTGACAPSPVPRLPSPVPVPASTFYVFRVLRPAPHARVFRVPHPAPAAPHPRLLRPVPVPPSSAFRRRLPVFRALSPPPALRGRSFRLLQAAGMKRKSGGSPEEPPDFACIAAARLTRACG